MLAIRRGGRYIYRPQPTVVLAPEDELIATGPDEGHTHLAALCGYELISDDETGEDELVPTGAGEPLVGGGPGAGPAGLGARRR